MQGKVPTPNGNIEIFVNKEQIKITGASGVGTVRIKSKTRPTGKNVSVTVVGGDVYEIEIKPGLEYVINYNAV
jgi:hypothetical protein